MSTQSVPQLNICQHCALSGVCLGNSVQESSTTSVKSHRVYHRDEPLYLMGDTFDALYILRSGSAKSYLSSPRGDEQISGFYHPGDLIGIEGFDTMTHAQGLKFLETSSVCRISLKEFNRAMGESASIRQQVLQSMSHSLNDEQQQLLSVSKFNAEQRLAKFLIDLSKRFKQRGLSGKVFDLSMTRIDIANFLGMAIETISRLLSKMQAQGIIDVNRRQITVLNQDKLCDCLVEENEKSEKYWEMPSASKAIQPSVSEPNLVA
jgi:CRP/FNR family transcriptional regulator